MTTEQQRHYTSIVYFHGMGNQRRYEEVSRLVDSLDSYAQKRKETEVEKVGYLCHIKAFIEPLRDNPEESIAYVQADQVTKDSTGDQKNQTVRFYETYWASLTAGVATLRGVFWWLLSQVLTPIKTFITPWRDRARLRRSALYHLWSNWRHRFLPDYTFEDIKEMLHCYTEFEGWEARRNYKHKGKFSDFKEFLRKRFVADAPKLRRMQNLAVLWRRYYMLTEVVKFVVLLTLLLTIILVFLLGLALATWIINALSGSELVSLLSTQGLQGLDDLLQANFTNSMVVLLLIVTVVGLRGFLVDYMGDVQIWASYEETDTKWVKRRQILDRSVQVLQHVLQDPLCDRVVVVAHSLGSTIAMDSLLEIGRYNRARSHNAPIKGPLPLTKLEHLITFGCPVDKIHYFFESDLLQHHHHRYNRVVDDIRGDIGEVPFASNRHPQIHWINFWDQADIIGGPLESTSNRDLPELVVDNCEVSCLPIPNPGASHGAYLDHEKVVSVIFHSIFNRSYSYIEGPKLPSGAPDYAAQQVGPGSGSWYTLLVQAFAMLLPWVFLGYVLSWLTSSS